MSDNQEAISFIFLFPFFFHLCARDQPPSHTNKNKTKQNAKMDGLEFHSKKRLRKKHTQRRDLTLSIVVEGSKSSKQCIKKHNINKFLGKTMHE